MVNQDKQWHIRCNGIKKDAAIRILHELKAPKGFIVDFFVESFNDDYWNLKMNKLLVEKRMEEIDNEMKLLTTERESLRIKLDMINNNINHLMDDEFKDFNEK